MSRRKNRESSSRAKRYQPMPWLSSCLTDQRPVFALTIQRMMSGCEMVDYGVPSNSPAEPAEALVTDGIAANNDLKLQLADFNGNTIFKEALGEPESLGVKDTEPLSLQPLDEPCITYDYASIIEGVSSAENWWHEDVLPEPSKLPDCEEGRRQPYELDERLVELMPSASSLVVSLPSYYEPYPSGEPQQLLEFGSGEMGGRYCEIEVLDDAKGFVELAAYEPSARLAEVPGQQAKTAKSEDRVKKKRKRDYGDAEKSIACSRCGKRFRKEGHLKTHFVVHTMNENGASLSYCAVCGKSFCHRGALTLHMRAHAPKRQPRGEIVM